MKKNKIFPRLRYWVSVTAVGVILGLAIQFVSAWTEPASAPPNGNVGAPINTGNIGQAKEGNLAISTNPLLPGGGIKANGLTVQYGNVGIGTTSPGQKLSIVSTDAFAGLDITDSSANRALMQWHSADGFRIDVVAAKPLIFSTSDTERMRILSTGNVGIGTTSPGQKLDVAGGVRGSELYTNDNVYLGYLGDWISNRLNQGVTTNAQPQFGRVYDDDRNYYIDSNTTSRMNSIKLNEVLDANGTLHLASNGRVYLLPRNGNQTVVSNAWGGNGLIVEGPTWHNNNWLYDGYLSHNDCRWSSGDYMRCPNGFYMAGIDEIGYNVDQFLCCRI